MKLAKLTLLTATILAGTSTIAHAQVNLPAADLHGVGATSIENILVQQMNCEGNIQNQLGTNAPALITEPSTDTYNGSPAYSCTAGTMQPNAQGHYIGTGSGGGRSGWETFSRGSKVPTGKNPFDPSGTDATWNHYQFAFTDGPIAQSDVTAYAATAAAQLTAGNNIGNPIQIPMYVLPVALAYSPAYGVNTATGQPLYFNNKYPQKVGTATVGGLRLTQTNYCAIFNGVVTNWNDLTLQASNGGQSLMDANDPRGVTGWHSEGVPIRLVGRSDNSGTSSIFTRHLAAVCGNDVDAGGTNKFQQSAGGLPYYSAGPNLVATAVDSASQYNGTAPSSSNGNFSNIVNDAAHESISGAYYNVSTGAIVTTAGVETAGLFMVAEGSNGVAAAIADTASNRTSTVNPAVTLNGKFGYVSGDFIAPVAGQTLYSAALSEIGKPTTFLMPSAKNASMTELPPQSTSNGTYSTADTRKVMNPTTNALENVDRANPLHWTAVLYPYSATAAIQGLTGLAAPTTGYAITGTTQLVTYTCFANNANRLALANLIGLLTGKAAKQNVAINAGVFSSTSATAPGLTVALGASSLPSAWNTAISATYLANTKGGLGTLVSAYNSSLGSYYSTASTTGHGLQISSAIPTTTAGLTKDVANGSCTSGQGA